MFTGIIEHCGSITRIETSPAGGELTVAAPSLASGLVVSASVAVNGCCLTVVACDNESFSADLSAETVTKTSFSRLKVGSRVNLEQPLTAGKEFGGHFVLGHVDCAARVAYLKPDGEGWLYGVEIPKEFGRYIVNKGSITIDGISLTVARWANPIAEIAVIPFTYEHTGIGDRAPGDAVNLEADILGKYIERYLHQQEAMKTPSTLSMEELVRQGF